MQTLRQIKNRIRSIENTRKITRAMQMISSVKLTRAKSAFRSLQAYSKRLETALKNVTGDTDTIAHPLLESRRNGKAIALCVIASDAGLCGTYNHAIMERANAFLHEHRDRKARILAVGQESAAYFRKKGVPVERAYLRLFGKFAPAVPDEITRRLIALFLAGEADEAYVAYTRFNPTLRHEPVVERFLPLDPPRPGARAQYLTEPGRDAILDRMLPQHLICKMRSILLEAFTAEHSARMLAMKNATENASELIDALTLQRNKARQASITQEVLEIANAAAALKG